MGEYLTVEEIAEKLRLPVESVRHWLRSGKLKGIKFGKVWRIPTENYNAFVKQCSEESKI